MVAFCSLGGGSGRPISIHNVTCIGNESKLIDCEHEVYTYFYCDHLENVGLVCDGKAKNTYLHNYVIHMYTDIHKVLIGQALWPIV